MLVLRFATIVPNAAPSAPDSAATDPPPGAGESLETSSMKSKVILFANSPSFLDAVQDKIEQYGYRPIANLTGHRIKRYNLHSGISIPSVRERGGPSLTNGDIVAIEPFVTDGAGRVGGKRNSNIYHLRQIRKIRDEKATELMIKIQDKYKGLPFAERWLHEIQEDATKNLQKLMRAGIVSYYPVLDELGKGIVSQSEHTLLITNNGNEVLTG